MLPLLLFLKVGWLGSNSLTGKKDEGTLFFSSVRPVRANPGQSNPGRYRYMDITLHSIHYDNMLVD
jgi:hypothetical protein